MFPTQENIPPSLGNQFSNLGPISSPKVRFITGYSETQVFLDLDPNVNPPIQTLL